MLTAQEIINRKEFERICDLIAKWGNELENLTKEEHEELFTRLAIRKNRYEKGEI